MAKISKPSRKGTPPPEFEASTNLTRTPNEDLRPLNFKVKASFKREFKTYATANDMSMVDTLKEAFDLLKTKYE